MEERPERWKAVADAVNRRMDELGIAEQADLAERADLSDASVRIFMTGRLRDGIPPKNGTRRKLCLALGWTLDSIERILAGLEPIELDATPSGGRPTPLKMADVGTEALERQQELLEKLDADVRQLAERVARLEAPRHGQGSH